MDDDLTGVNHNLQVSGEGHVVKVEKVVAQTFDHFVDSRSVAVFDLTPGGDAGFDALEEQVLGGAFDNLVDVELALGAWSHNRHGPTKDVVELGNLVEAHLPHEAAEGGDARVVVLGEGGTR